MMRWHGIYARLLSHRVIHLYIASFLFFATLIFSWWYFFYSPTRKRCILLEGEITQLHAQLKDLSNSQQEIVSSSKSLSEIKQNVATNSAKKNSLEMKALLVDIMRTALEAQMQNTQCKIDATKHNSVYDTVLICGESTGSYDQITNFFEKLAQNIPRISINECSITKIGTRDFSLKMRFAAS